MDGDGRRGETTIECTRSFSLKGNTEIRWQMERAEGLKGSVFIGFALYDWGSK